MKRVPKSSEQKKSQFSYLVLISDSSPVNHLLSWVGFKVKSDFIIKPIRYVAVDKGSAPKNLRYLVDSARVIEIVPQQDVVESRGHDAVEDLRDSADELTDLEGYGEQEG
jgi:hypothetical protein